MKEKLNSKKVDLTELSILYRENILLADVTEKTPNGVWIETLEGDSDFISRAQIRAMYNFLGKCL